MKKFTKIYLLILLMLTSVLVLTGCDMLDSLFPNEEDNKADLIAEEKKISPSKNRGVDELINDGDAEKQPQLKVVDVKEEDILTKLPNGIDEEMYSTTGNGYYAFGYDNFYYRAVQVGGNHDNLINMSNYCRGLGFEYISARYRLNFTFDDTMFYKGKVEQVLSGDKVDDNGDIYVYNRSRISNTQLLAGDFGIPNNIREYFAEQPYRSYIPVFPVEYLEEFYYQVWYQGNMNFNWTNNFNIKIRDCYNDYYHRWIYKDSITNDEQEVVEFGKGYFYNSAINLNNRIILKDGKYYQITCIKTNETRDYFMGEGSSDFHEKGVFDYCVDKARQNDLISDDYWTNKIKTYYNTCGNGVDAANKNGKFNPATCGTHIELNVYKAVYTEVQVNIIKNETK